MNKEQKTPTVSELARLIRRAKGVGSRAGNAIINAGLIEGRIHGNWWSDDNCETVKLDIEKLKSIVADRSILRYRNVGKNVLGFLRAALRVSVTQCSHCGSFYEIQSK